MITFFRLIHKKGVNPLFEAIVPREVEHGNNGDNTHIDNTSPVTQQLLKG